MVGMVKRRELLLGCGHRRVKVIQRLAFPEWTGLVTLDRSPDVGASVVADLEAPLPFRDETFDEVHAYEVLEHLGRQGDWKSFFFHFGEIWRILKPGGHLMATCPMWNNYWAWSDPSHTRVISLGSLMFLDQNRYAVSMGQNCMTDFRFHWKKNFVTVWIEENGGENKDQFAFILEKR